MSKLGKRLIDSVDKTIRELALERENEELRQLLRIFYGWTLDYPIKHPQQAEWRERARKSIDARADAG